MSERSLSTNIKNLIDDDEVRPAVFIQADFPSGVRRIWTGVGPHTFRGHEFTGVGGVLGIDTISETVDSGAQGMQITLNGLDETLISDLVDDDYQGQPVYIWLGFWDESHSTLYTMDDAIWQGVMDTDEIEDLPGESTLKINVEHRLVDILRRREVRYTRKDQDYLYSRHVNSSFETLRTARWFHTGAPSNTTMFAGQALTGVGSYSTATDGAIGKNTVYSGAGLHYEDDDAWNAVPSTGLAGALVVYVSIEDLLSSGSDQAWASKWSAYDDDRGWWFGYDATNNVLKFKVSSDGTDNPGTTSEEITAEVPVDWEYWDVVFFWWDEVNEKIGIQIGNRAPSEKAWANGIHSSTAPFCCGGNRDNNPTNSEFGTLKMDDIVLFDLPLTVYDREKIWNRGRGLSSGFYSAVDPIDVEDTGLDRIEQIQDTTVPWGRTQS